MLTGPGMYAEGQVCRRAAQGARGVDETAGQIEAVPRAKGDRHHGVGRCGRAHVLRPVIPGLVAQGVAQDGRVDVPLLLAVHLDDEDVVDVIVRGESLTRGRGDIGIRLHRMAELSGEFAGEIA